MSIIRENKTSRSGLIIERGKIRLSKKGEQSTHILKPIPLSRLRRVKEIPANENLTMQIASQIYGIEAAANAVIGNFEPSKNGKVKASV